MHGNSALCHEDCDFPGCIEYQSFASDINGDGYIWTIADLVALLHCVNGFTTPPATASTGPIEVFVANDEVIVSSDIELGGAYFTIEYEGDAVPELNIARMEMRYGADGGIMRVVVYSMKSATIPNGTHILFRLPGIKSIKAVNLADGAGNLLNVSVFTEPPAGFAIKKVVPNPIRERSAEIFFSVATAAKASLKVYDSAGRAVTTLVDGIVQKGLHKVKWDARDFPNGVYFCRMAIRSIGSCGPVGETYTCQRTREFTSAKKIILLR